VVPSKVCDWKFSGSSAAAFGLLNNNDTLFIFAARRHVCRRAGKIDKTRLARLTKFRRVAAACQSRWFMGGHLCRHFTSHRFAAVSGIRVLEWKAMIRIALAAGIACTTMILAPRAGADVQGLVHPSAFASDHTEVAPPLLASGH
jgi:hypothetical protein